MSESNVARFRAMLPPAYQEKIGFEPSEIVALGLGTRWTVLKAIRDGKLEVEWLTQQTRRVPIDSLADWFFKKRPEADGTERYRRMVSARWTS